MSDHMMRLAPKTLGALFQGLAELPHELTIIPCQRLVMDSRDVQSGDVFVAMAGDRHHGVQFLNSAVNTGAIAAVAEAPVDLPNAPPIPVTQVQGLREMLPEIARRLSGAATDALWTIGVTGTDGKTSVSYFLSQALNSQNHRFGLLGTLGNGYPDALEPSSHTTKDVLSLHAAMAGFLADGAEGVALEVSSHALDQQRVAGLAFDVAVLTQLGRDHLDYHGTQEAYALAKRQLFYWPGLHWRVINADDPFGRSLLARPTGEASDLAYGLNPMLVRGAADHVLFAKAIHPYRDGIEVVFDGSWGHGLMRTGLLGRFNVANLLAVLGVLLIRGFTLKQSLRLIEGVESAPGRMQRLGGGDKPTVVVDYAHTPGALKSAIEAIRAHVTGRLITVFGCGGDRDKGKRPLMGEVAATLSDRVWVTDDNPRTEDPDAIVAEIMAGVPEANRANVTVERDRARAIDHAINEATSSDIVLVAGKGHETVQLIGVQRIPFSDVECAQRSLEGFEA
ncbi:MAG: UDP-N-acetylmuramoyl-L-alanyl-D-glutamate--2,6-diaminopimelate ligase [Gammaproteobacteria bacterium]